MGPRAVVAAPHAARLDPGKPMADVGVEHRVVVDAVREYQVQAIQRPAVEIFRAAAFDGRDVVAALCLEIEVLA